jgi:hypothetical protein
VALPLSLIPSIARAVDISTRQDAIAGHIAGERDYMGAFLATFRNVWRLLGGRGEMFNAVLPPNSEQATGCDVMLILQGEKTFKLVLLEAKWVRSGPWDKHRAKGSGAANARYGPPPPSKSRFSDQIARQQAWQLANPSHFIAEMFLQLDAPFPPTYNNALVYDQQGSTFITHARASDVVSPPLIAGTVQIPAVSLWNTAANEQLALQGFWMDAQALLQGVVDCQFGEPMSGRWLDHINEFAQTELPKSPLSAMTSVGLSHMLILEGETPTTWL